MKGQQYRYRSRRKTTTGCGDCVVLIMRIREVRHQAITLAGAVPDIRNCSALRVALLAEVQDGHTTGLVWQKCGLNPPLGFYHGKFNDRR